MERGESKMAYDVIVAGGGPAGLTSAIYSARAGWRTLIVDPLGGGGQASTTDAIYNYPGFPGGIEGQRLTDLMLQQAKGFGAELVWDEVHEVTRNAEGFRVRGGELQDDCKVLIWAAGTRPKRLGVPGEEKFLGRGISFCATCDGALFKDKVVAVVGGGDSALTEAQFLSRLAREVVLIHRRSDFRAGQALVREIKNNPRVRLVLNSEVEEIRGDGTVKSVVVRDIVEKKSTEVPVDGVFLYIGSQPNAGPILYLVDANEQGYIKTREDMSTKTAGLFAAGDVREKPFRQVTTAVNDGAIAAWAAELYLLGTKR